MADRRFGKDFFSWIRLPVAREYVQPPGRRGLFAAGAVAAVVAGALFVADAFAGRAGAVTGGELSDSHALFAAECTNCHTPFEGAEDRKCSSCHEQAGTTLARYGWERHYLYRSEDYDRSAAASLEMDCAACHAEHRGRAASLEEVPDESCSTCHEAHDFSEGHPEFDFVAEDRPDRANLVFPHIVHVREVMADEELDVVEESCLYCHVPEDDGRSFRPISFARSCDACHLSDGRTEALPVVDGAGPGVWTLDAIRAAGGAGSLWASYWDPNEFRSLGGRVVKSPVYHADPWILENLRRIRRELYPGVTLADLLRASADLPSATHSPRTLYDEAMATLRTRIEALGGEPSADVQEELDRLTGLLERLEQRLEDPYEPLDDTRFLVRVADRALAEQVSDAELQEYAAVVDDLTAECTACHVVDNATIARVQADQRTLVRTEFDHRAHVIHARCLDCHTRIPVEEWALSEEDPPEGVDLAEIQNLPGIESCRSCHSDEGPATDCTSCHLFHPDRGYRSELTRTAGGTP